MQTSFLPSTFIAIFRIYIVTFANHDVFGFSKSDSELKKKLFSTNCVLLCPKPYVAIFRKSKSKPGFS